MKNFISENLITTLYVINLIIVLGISIIIIYNHTKRDPIRTVMWIIVLYFIPVIGIILYLFFGQNYRKTKIFNRKELRDLKYIERMSKQQLLMLHEEDIFEQYPDKSAYKKIMTLLLNNSKALLTEFNEIDVYYNGTDTFDTIKKALRSAKTHIHIESYIIQGDKIGNEIKDILIEKVKEGVKIRVLYDDVGSWGLSKKYKNDLKEAGVNIAPFLKVAFPIFGSKLNYRNHRKIIVVDGKISFMGGINIADRYIDGGPFAYWCDTHIQIRGESALILQAIFLTDWYFATKEILMRGREIYFPQINVANKLLTQIVSSGPDSDWAGTMHAYFTIINTARKNIYVSTPYFTPNESILTALKTSALSGIDVRIMLPSKGDSKLVYWSTLSYVTELMESGIKVYFYTKGFNHSKYITIDGNVSSIGSANMDMRSFEHNFEITAIVYNSTFSENVEAQFLHDINKNSYKVSPKHWANRHKLKKMREGVARLFTPLL